MVTEPIISNGEVEAVGLKLVPCSNHAEKSCENVAENSDNKKEMLLINGVGSHVEISCENVDEDSNNKKEIHLVNGVGTCHVEKSCENVDEDTNNKKEMHLVNGIGTCHGEKSCENVDEDTNNKKEMHLVNGVGTCHVEKSCENVDEDSNNKKEMLLVNGVGTYHVDKSCENVDEDSNNKKEMLLVDGVGTYHVEKSCENVDEDSNSKKEMLLVDGVGMYHVEKSCENVDEDTDNKKEMHSINGVGTCHVEIFCENVVEDNNNKKETLLVNGVGMDPVEKSFENVNEDSNYKKEMHLVNGVRTYKRRKHSHMTSDDMPAHAKASPDAGGHPICKNATDAHIGINSDGSSNKLSNEANVHFNSELCRNIFNDVIISENFNALCKLFAKNFQGIKIESFPHFSILDSRIRDGAYGHSPQLFSEDIQQLWSTLQRIGIEMASLAKSLSDMSLEICHEQLGVSVDNDSGDGKQEMNKFLLRNKDCLGLDIANQHLSLEELRHSKPDQTDADRSSICRCCGGKTDDRICIVCDSCEKIYHVFCVGVSVSKDSPRSWYCMNCGDVSLQSSHQDCVVCERIHVSSTETHVGEDKRDDVACGVLNSGSQQSGKSHSGRTCKLCKCEFSDDEYRECEHYLCRNMFHLRCLSDLELKRFGPRWYCTSCLCRVCLVDRDDEKIVLCDGCDNAYHIYCMEPPRTSIPPGKWFCRVCDTRLQKIHKAKRIYENHRPGTVVNTDSEDQKGLSGKVDAALVSKGVLLSSAEMLKNEEKLVQ